MVKLAPKEKLVVDYCGNKQKYIFDSRYAVYLKKKGITVKECGNVLGTTELRKIVSDLKAKGFEITDIWEDGKDKFGDGTRYKRYFIGARKC